MTLTCYAASPDITLTVTPDLKRPGRGVLLLVDLGAGKNRLGGSALATVYSQLGDSAPDVDDSSVLKRCFEATQSLLQDRLIESGHDRSDGGLIVSVVEMAFAGNCGVSLNLPLPVNSDTGLLGVLFGEELGLVIEVQPENVVSVMEVYQAYNIPCSVIGKVTMEEDARIIVYMGDEIIIDEAMVDLRDIWESTSFALEELQCNLQCTSQEKSNLRRRRAIPYKVTYEIPPVINITSSPSDVSHKIAVIRQEGSNGDREMLSAFHAAGLEAWDVNMFDLANGSITLDRFRGVVFCGGFSYADVNDSAKGWAAVIRFNHNLQSQFETFRKRNDTFSLGVCNGCQLMALLGWIPFVDEQVDEIHQPRFIHNSSGRFESRWSTIKISPSPSVLLREMEGSVFGVWVAHGEGRLYCPKEGQLEDIEKRNLAPIRYVDDFGFPTMVYPNNPNGSLNGIASLVSADGRHLAMMPHPERCFLSWQCPYMPLEFKQKIGYSGASPWMKLFHNAKRFCEER